MGDDNPNLTPADLERMLRPQVRTQNPPTCHCGAPATVQLGRFDADQDGPPQMHEHWAIDYCCERHRPVVTELATTSPWPKLPTRLYSVDQDQQTVDLTDKPWPPSSAPARVDFIIDADGQEHHRTPITAYFEGKVVRSHTPLGEALDVWSDTGLRLSDVDLSPIRGLSGKRVRVTVEVLDG